MIVTLCQIRLDNTRFPEKALKKINNITIAEYMIRAMNKIYYSNLNAFIVPEKEKDIEVFSKFDINVFSGSEFNVLKRYTQAVEKIEELFNYNEHVDHIVRITGDCPLLCYAEGLIDKIILRHIINRNDYTQNRSLKSGYCSGFDVEVMTREILFESLNSKDKEEQEHVTMFVKNNLKNYKYENIDINPHINHKLKWSVDDEESFNRVSDLINILESKIIKY